MNIMQVGKQVLSHSVLPVRQERELNFNFQKPVRVLSLFRLMRTRSNGMVFLISFLTYLLGIFPSLVYALPTSGSVQAGSATIDQVSENKITH